MNQASTISTPEDRTRAAAGLRDVPPERPEIESSPADAPLTTIRPPGLIAVPDLVELWRYRDLLLLLSGRNIAAMYRMSVLGLGWSLVRPIFTTLIFTFIVVYVLGRGDMTGDIPYPVFALAGLIPWTYFATSLTNATNSVVSAQSMLSKVYFPRLVLPLSSLAVAGIEVLIQCGLLVALMIFYQVPPGPQILAVPLYLLLATLAALAGGLWLTALNVRYRDVQFVLPFATQLLMYLCPVIYPASQIPEKYHALYFLNPMAGVVEGFRWSLIGTPPPDWTMMALSAGVTMVVLVTGLFFFARTEQTFADII